MTPLYRHTDLLEWQQRKKAEGCRLALSDVDKSLILVEGIVFVHT